MAADGRNAGDGGDTSRGSGRGGRRGCGIRGGRGRGRGDSRVSVTYDIFILQDCEL